MYDGRVSIGAVYSRDGDRFAAFDDAGEVLGDFPKIHLAVDAVLARHREAAP